MKMFFLTTSQSASTNSFSSFILSLLPLAIIVAIVVFIVLIVRLKAKRQQRPVNMNGQLGIKWFIFFTKVRPVLSCIFVLSTISDYARYKDIYERSWWLMLYFGFAIVMPVLAVSVANKAKGDYIDFVKFVKGVLLFEIVSISYESGVWMYLSSKSNIVMALIMAGIVFLIGYFLWYRLNVKYFKKRILQETPTIEENDYDSMAKSFQISVPSETPHTNGNFHISGNDVRLQVEDKKETAAPAPIAPPKILFCRKCGNKLVEDSLFCNKCGTKVITNGSQGE